MFTKYIFILNINLDFSGSIISKCPYWSNFESQCKHSTLQEGIQIRRKIFPKFPYSILLAGVGLLFAIIGWVLSIVMYCELRKQRLQSLQDQNLNEAAETCPVASQDQIMTDTAYASIPGSQDQDIRED